MAISVTGPTHLHTPTAVQPSASRQPAPTSRPQTSPAVKPQPVATDTVRISTAAKALQKR